MNNKMLQTLKNGITFFHYPPWEKGGQVELGFSSRCGGVSKKPYDKLNLGYKWGDRTADVAENRRLFLALWDKDEQDLVCGDQVHGTNIALVGKKMAGALIPETDGLITVEAGVVLGAFSADCLLIYLWDPSTRAIGLIHAGWRGTLSGIVFFAVEKMQAQLGSRPERMQALLSPCIRSCCYVIGADVIEMANRSNWSDQVVCYPTVYKGHALLDLQQTNHNILFAAGLRQNNIGTSSFCTYCNPSLFYSYRRTGEEATGSHMGIIFLTER